jgi:hypothetical protein
MYTLPWQTIQPSWAWGLCSSPAEGSHPLDKNCGDKMFLIFSLFISKFSKYNKLGPLVMLALLGDILAVKLRQAFDIFV